MTYLSKIEQIKIQKLLGYDDAFKTPLALISVVVAEYYGIDEEYIFHRCRDLYVLKIRYTFMALARELNDRKISYAYIGEFCETRYGMKKYDHATVMNALKNHRNMFETMPDYRDHYLKIKAEIEMLAEKLRRQTDEVKLFKTQLIYKIHQALGIEDIKALLAWYNTILTNADLEQPVSN